MKNNLLLQKIFTMALYKFTQAYSHFESPMLGGQLIKAFNVGDVVEGTYRVYNIPGGGFPSVAYVDTQWGALPAQYLQQLIDSPIPRPGSLPDVNNIPAPVGLLGLAAIFIFLKVVKII